MVGRTQRWSGGPDAVRDWMERSGLNQRQAAVRMGIGHTALNHLLCARRRAGLAMALRIQRATGIPVEAWMSTPVDKRRIVSISSGRKSLVVKA
jgi:transcriptional regulator with XRE-family HTH domain